MFLKNTKIFISRERFFLQIKKSLHIKGYFITRNKLAEVTFKCVIQTFDALTVFFSVVELHLDYRYIFHDSYYIFFSVVATVENVSWGSSCDIH